MRDEECRITVSFHHHEGGNALCRPCWSLWLMITCCWGWFRFFLFLCRFTKTENCTISPAVLSFQVRFNVVIISGLKGCKSVFYYFSYILLCWSMFLWYRVLWWAHRWSRPIEWLLGFKSTWRICNYKPTLFLKATVIVLTVYFCVFQSKRKCQRCCLWEQNP